MLIGNTAVDLDPLPVSRACLTVVEPALFESDMFEMAAPIQSPPKCEVRSVIRTKRMGSALKFLTRYAQEGAEFLDSIVTGDEKFVFLHTPGSSTMMIRCKKKPRRSSELAADFYDSGIQKLVPRLNKCLDNACDYVEK